MPSSSRVFCTQSINPCQNFLPTKMMGTMLILLVCTMVNIIADKTVFEEFLQHHFVPEELLEPIESILPGGKRRDEVEKGMREVVSLLSPQGSNAAQQAAEKCFELIK